MGTKKLLQCGFIFFVFMLLIKHSGFCVYSVWWVVVWQDLGFKECCCILPWWLWAGVECGEIKADDPQEQKCRWQRTQTPPLLRSHWWRSYEGFNCCTMAASKSWMPLQCILDVVPSKNGPKTPSKNKKKKKIMMMLIWTGKSLKNSSHRL